MRQPPSIDAYGGGGFRIAGARHAGGVLILDDAVEPWAAMAMEAVDGPALLGRLERAAAPPEFLLLGLGATLRPPPRALREVFAEAGVGLEVMTTPEACRLYNVLASEGRRLALALLPV